MLVVPRAFSGLYIASNNTTRSIDGIGQNIKICSIPPSPEPSPTIQGILM